jgi:hypothetical protein
MADTAALIEPLDLVIAVDTAVAHLAAALAKPVWLLLPFSPDWRGLQHRSDSPWYPTMRLFRQPALGDWTSVIASVRAALCDLTSNEPSQPARERNIRFKGNQPRINFAASAPISAIPAET